MQSESNQTTATYEKMKDWLGKLVFEQLDEKGRKWLEKQLTKIVDQKGGRSLQLAFGMIPRFTQKKSFNLSKEQVAEGQELVPDIRPDSWSLLVAARILCLLHLPYEESIFVEQIEKIFDTADEGEATALYAGIPLYPFPKAFIARASEGVRTNMTSVFDAIVLRNPFPKQYFGENAWNQMFLKAIFTNRPIHHIQGIEERANAALAQIISDYAHERWAAGRDVTPEIWRPIGPFLTIELLPDIAKLCSSMEILEQKAAVLSCQASSLPEAQQLLNTHPEVKALLDDPSTNWSDIGIALEQK